MEALRYKHISYIGLGIGRSLTDEDILNSITLEKSNKMVYIPCVLSQVAFEYADFVCRLCKEKKLKYNKQTRAIKENIVEYQKKTYDILSDEMFKTLQDKVDYFFEEAHGHIEKLQFAIQGEMKKIWPELEDYSILLNLYMCVILIDLINKFDKTAAKTIEKTTFTSFVPEYDRSLLAIRKACMEIAGERILPNTDIIKTGISALAMNVDKMIKVEFYE